MSGRRVGDREERLGAVFRNNRRVVEFMAAKAGASFISPFIGRLDDIGENGLVLLQDIIDIYRNYSWKTEVLAASMRSPIHVIEAARMGADIATIPFKVIDQLFNHPLTDKGEAQFLADWHKSGRQ